MENLSQNHNSEMENPHEQVPLVPKVQGDREVTPQPGPSKSSKPVTTRRHWGTTQYRDSSDSSDSDIEISENSTDTDKENENPLEESNISFSEMFSPDMSRRSTTRRRNPALNSRAQVVTKDLFKKNSNLSENISSPRTASSSELKNSNKLSKPVGKNTKLIYQEKNFQSKENKKGSTK